MNDAPELVIIAKDVNNKDLTIQIESLKCCVCLNLVYMPLECTMCQTIMCTGCYLFNKSMGINCVSKRCVGEYKKVNKYVRDMLKSIDLYCQNCGKLNYSEYEIHVKNCIKDKRQERVELTRDLNNKNEKLTILENEMKTMQSSLLNFKRNNVALLSKLPVENLREVMVTCDLPLRKKKEIYMSVVNGNIKEVTKLFFMYNYPILEEISKRNYYWTALHYAMHYGQFDVICLILNKLRQDGLLTLAMKLESNDGRCPIMCLLKSNSLDKIAKYEVLEKLIQKFPQILNQKNKVEIQTKGYEHILDKFNVVY
jgi:hypothetical protein